VLRGDQNHCRARGPPILDEQASEIEGALIADHDVDEDNIGTELTSPSERLVDRRGNPDDVEPFALQQRLGRVEKGAVVINDEVPQGHILRVSCAADGRIVASLNSAVALLGIVSAGCLEPRSGPGL